MLPSPPQGNFDPAFIDADWTIIQTSINSNPSADTPLVAANPHRIAIAFAGSVNGVIWLYNKAGITNKTFFPLSGVNSVAYLVLLYSQWGNLVGQPWIGFTQGQPGTVICVTEQLWLPKGG